MVIRLVCYYRLPLFCQYVLSAYTVRYWVIIDPSVTQSSKRYKISQVLFHPYLNNTDMTTVIGLALTVRGPILYVEI